MTAAEIDLIAAAMREALKPDLDGLRQELSERIDRIEERLSGRMDHLEDRLDRVVCDVVKAVSAAYSDVVAEQARHRKMLYELERAGVLKGTA